MKKYTKPIAVILSFLCIAAMTSCGNRPEEMSALPEDESIYTQQETVPAETSAEASVSEKTSAPSETSAADIISFAATSAAVQPSESTTASSSEKPAEAAPSEGSPPLVYMTPEAEQKLREDYLELMQALYDRPDLTIEQMSVKYYYGTYSNGEVVAMDAVFGAAANGNLFSVAGYDFYLPGGSYEIMLHKGSEFIPLAEAYESGLLSDTDMEEIYFHEKKYFPYAYEDPMELTPEAEQKLREDYADFLRSTPDRRGGIAADDMFVAFYFGTYNGSEVVLMNAKPTYDMYIVSAAGFDFILPVGNRGIMLHRDSTFIPISEAYESGLLTDRDIAKIHYYAQQYSEKLPEEYPDFPELTPEAEQKLLEDYAGFASEKHGGTDFTADDMSVVYYYGAFRSGDVAVIYPHDHTFTEDVKYFSVAGYDFALPSGSYEIMLHTASTFVPLADAYSSGLLTDSEIMEINYNAQQIYPCDRIISEE